MPTTKEPKFKIPAKLGECADLLYKLREQRYELNRQAAAIEEKEKMLNEHLIQTLPTSQATGISGRVANATVKTKDIQTVEDWDAVHKWCIAEFQKHAKKKDGLELAAFGVFQRRLATGAVDERLQRGEKIPGLKPMTVKTISLTKV